jgi:hypothetical protein
MPPHVILLSGNPIYPQEKIAAEAFLPGHLLEIVPSGGDAGQLRKHTTASGNAMKAFANVSLTPDAGVATEAIDTPWADGETVRWLIGRSGDMVYALLPAAAAAVVDGSPLVSNGDGTLKIAAAAAATGATVEGVVGYAAEAVDNSAGGTAVRVRVRIS